MVIGETQSVIPLSRKQTSGQASVDTTSQTGPETNPSPLPSSSLLSSPLHLTFLLVLSTDAEDLDNPAVYLLDPRFVTPAATTSSSNCWWSEDKMIPHEYLTNFLASLEPQNDTVFRSTAEMDDFVEEQMLIRCNLYAKLKVHPSTPALSSSHARMFFIGLFHFLLLSFFLLLLLLLFNS